jgi:ABC-type transporter Mla subunit MlaD
LEAFAINNPLMNFYTAKYSYFLKVMTASRSGVFSINNLFTLDIYYIKDSMKISDKALGYFSFFAIILLLSVVTLEMYNAHQINIYEIEVDFKELGSIQPQDAVTIDGYKVGQIGSIKWLGDKARLQLKFDEPVVLRKGTRIINSNYALMGQRRIEIIRSKTGEVVPKDYVFEGEFQPGIAEALRLIENFQTQMDIIRDIALLLIHGDSVTPSVPKMFETKMEQMDNLISSLEKLSEQVNSQVNGLLVQTTDASQQIIQTADNAKTLLDTIQKTTSTKIEEANQALSKVSKASSGANDFILSIENNPSIDKLLSSTEKIEKINELIKKVNILSQAIQEKGIAMYNEKGEKVKIFPFKNMNIIGKTAREKAKDREKDALMQKNQ